MPNSRRSDVPVSGARPYGSGYSLIDDRPPNDALAPGMPDAAMGMIVPDFVVPLRDIGATLDECIRGALTKAAS